MNSTIVLSRNLRQRNYWFSHNYCTSCYSSRVSEAYIRETIRRDGKTVQQETPISAWCRRCGVRGSKNEVIFHFPAVGW